MAKVKLDLTDLSITALIATLQNIVAKMTGNAVYTAIAAKVTALNAAITALVAANGAYNAAVSDTSAKLTARDDRRVDAENAARALASAAEGESSDAADLESGGFGIQATAAPVGDMPAPENLSAAIGDMDGEVDCNWNAIRRGVQTYIAEYATSPSGPWTQFYVGKPSKATAPGLTSGTQYWFRVRAVGANGPGPWSDPATSRAR
jgi:hypothetical protein